MVVTVEISGIPRHVPLKSLGRDFDAIFDTDEIGSFRVREIGDGSSGGKRRIALDFSNGYDAMTVQQMLDSKNFHLTGDILCSLRARVCKDLQDITEIPKAPTMGLVCSTSFRGELDMADVKNANFKLDSQLEILKKTRLVLKEERKVLKEKKKLEKEYKMQESSESEDEVYVRKKKHKRHSESKPKLHKSIEGRSSLEVIMPPEDNDETTIKDNIKSTLEHSEYKVKHNHRYNNESREDKRRSKRSPVSESSSFDDCKVVSPKKEYRSLSPKRYQLRSPTKERVPNSYRSRSPTREYRELPKTKEQRDRIPNRYRPQSPTRDRSKVSTRYRSPSRTKDYEDRSYKREFIDLSPTRDYRDRSHAREYREQSHIEDYRERSLTRDRDRSHKDDFRERSLTRDRDRSRKEDHRDRSQTRDRDRSHKEDYRERSQTRDRDRSRTMDYRDRSQTRREQSPERYRSQSRSSIDLRSKLINQTEFKFKSPKSCTSLGKAQERHESSYRDSSSKDGTDKYNYLSEDELSSRNGQSTKSLSTDYKRSKHYDNDERESDFKIMRARKIAKLQVLSELDLVIRDFTFGVSISRVNKKELTKTVQDLVTKRFDEFSFDFEAADELVDYYRTQHTLEEDKGLIKKLVSECPVLPDVVEGEEGEIEDVDSEDEEESKAALWTAVDDVLQGITIDEIKADGQDSDEPNKDGNESVPIKTDVCKREKIVPGNPQFITPIRALTRQMRKEIKDAEASCKYLYHITKRILQDRLKEIMRGKEYCKHCEIIVAYRQMYNKESDSSFIKQIVSDINNGTYELLTTELELKNF